MVSLPQNGSERHSESIFLFFVARERIPSCVLFCGMVRNRIPRISIYFGSTEWNSELFSLPQKGSEQNYGSLFLFLVHGTEFRVVFSSTEGFGTTGIPSDITICSVYSVFRGIIFLSEISNSNPDQYPDPHWKQCGSTTQTKGIIHSWLMDLTCGYSLYSN